ncbi:hypothetical protein TWF481_006760 [Arthrobotrys musiformis]|uniref:Uncharacterized protein n=1 Tax=Arthrobotrys musiformis TaxID=47236 RepID=A0AAV9WBH6_9PEZI
MSGSYNLTNARRGGGQKSSSSGAAAGGQLSDSQASYTSGGDIWSLSELSDSHDLRRVRHSHVKTTLGHIPNVPPPKTRRGYPHEFKNKEGFPMPSGFQDPATEFPILPAPNTYSGQGPPGAGRVVYDQTLDPETSTLLYHPTSDPSGFVQAKRRPGSGRKMPKQKKSSNTTTSSLGNGSYLEDLEFEGGDAAGDSGSHLQSLQALQTQQMMDTWERTNATDSDNHADWESQGSVYSATSYGGYAGSVAGRDTDTYSTISSSSDVNSIASQYIDRYSSMASRPSNSDYGSGYSSNGSYGYGQGHQYY